MRPTNPSLRWSEEKSFGRRSFYNHLALNGATGNKILLRSELNSLSAANSSRYKTNILTSGAGKSHKKWSCLPIFCALAW